MNCPNHWSIKLSLLLLLTTFTSLSVAEEKMLLVDNTFYNISDLNNTSSLISNKSIDYIVSASQQFMIEENSKARVDAHAQFLKQHKDIKVTLNIYTQASGSREYSLGLGYKYGYALKKILISLGVAEYQIKVVSHGEHIKAINQIEFNYQNTTQ